MIEGKCHRCGGVLVIKGEKTVEEISCEHCGVFFPKFKPTRTYRKEMRMKEKEAQLALFHHE